MKHRSFLLPFLIFCLTLLLALPVFANAAEPPCLTVVVVGAPDDLSLALVHDDGEEAFQLVKRQMTRGWETYFRFTYSHVILPGMTDALDGFDLSALRLSVTAQPRLHCRQMRLRFTITYYSWIYPTCRCKPSCIPDGWC